MGFVIATGVSPNFADVFRLVVPSWIRHSRADGIWIKHFDGGVHATPHLTWYANVPLRCAAMRDSVLEAQKLGKQIVCLDADCFVLRDLAGGFSPDHPFSVARWPNFNMGVIFFNTLLNYDFASLLNEMAVHVAERCAQLIRKKMDKIVPGDQHIWHELLHPRERDVCKLDMTEWNFCYGPAKWHKLLKANASRIRIAHMKGRFRRRDEKLKQLKAVFKDKL